VLVGREIPEDRVRFHINSKNWTRFHHRRVATDAPLVSHQLKRLARRVSSASAATAASRNGSGDIFIAFSTRQSRRPAAAGHIVDLKIFQTINWTRLCPTVQATKRRDQCHGAAEP